MTENSDGLPDDLTSPEASALIRQQEMVKSLKDDIARGLYSRRHLRQKYGKYFDEQEMVILIDGLVTQIARENVIDIRMEIIGYLMSSDEFQHTLYAMMEREEKAGRSRNVVEIVKLLQSLKNDRLEFIEEIGIPLALYREGKKIERPEQINLGVMLEAGQKALEDARRRDIENFAGKLADGREGDDTRELEGKQVSVHPASSIS